jgi:hypothetical protein
MGAQAHTINPLSRSFSIMAQQGNNYAGNRRNTVRNIVKAEDRKIVDFAGILHIPVKTITHSG